MRIVAIYAVFNEERFIERSIEHSIEQGVESYVIDNESTDRTLEIAKTFLGRGVTGVETFPRHGVFEWAQLLRRKHVIGVFQRLPALDVLDSIGLKSVTVGFPLFTIGLVTGTFWVARGGLGLSAGQGFGLIAWLFFGSVLLARVAAGWRGRRAAIGTMLGFLFALAAIGGYLLRDLHLS